MSPYTVPQAEPQPASLQYPLLVGTPLCHTCLLCCSTDHSIAQPLVTPHLRTSRCLCTEFQAFLIDSYINILFFLKQVKNTRKGANDCWLCFHTGLVNVAVFNIPAKTRMNNNKLLPGFPDRSARSRALRLLLGHSRSAANQDGLVGHRLLQCCYQKMSLSCVNDWNFQASLPSPFLSPSPLHLFLSHWVPDKDDL